jgi:hypothetical protein
MAPDISTTAEPSGRPGTERTRLVVPAGGQVPSDSPAGRGAEATIPLPVGTWVVGRDRACDVRLDDPSVAHRHARLHVKDDGSPVRLEDLGSGARTEVDGHAVTGADLVNGSTVRLGGLLLVLAQDEDPDAGRQGGGPHASEVDDEADQGSTSGTPVGAGPVGAAVRRTSNVLWLAVVLMAGGFALAGAGVAVLSGSVPAGTALLGVGVLMGIVGLAVAAHGRIFDDVS